MRKRKKSEKGQKVRNKNTFFFKPQQVMHIWDLNKGHEARATLFYFGQKA